MKIENNIISKKYALEFFIHYKKIVLDDEQKLINLKKTLEDDKSWKIPFSLPNVLISKKQIALEMLINQFSLDDSYKKLTILLLNHGKIFLLNEVIYNLIACCDNFNNKEKFKVYSSHTLTKEEKEKIYKFVQSATSTNVVISFSVDTKLISGLRIQSSKNLWERSIAKQLRTIKYCVTQKGAI